ncbi:retrovirus-related Pol polyprotein from transposon 412 [Trichonephila clavipes]|nr:retrovirus-related Pol polyprotein from transposon 412 [Trichonephila clavipes]
MFQIFKDKGLLLQETTLAMSLADGQQTTGEVLTTQVMVEIEGRSVLTKFIILPKAKENRTLLGTDFLSSAGLVLDVKNTCWYFWDNPTHKYPFGEELDTPSIVEKMSSNTCQLREGEGGEATNILEHHINTGNSPPISVPSYRMSPVKNCPDCIKYKASNQKPSGLLRTPVPAQRFETLAIDLFGPLHESQDAKECAIALIEDVLLRYGIPRRLISDNGTQFVSAVLQQICYLLNIHQSPIPVYHPQANPVERKNRDLKPRLAILVQDKHDCCSEKLSFIRFALNTAKCETTGQTAAFLNFCRKLRTPSEVVNDIRVVIQNDNFVPEITPYLKKFVKFSTQIREVVEEQQDSRKFYAGKKRKTAPTYQPAEHVFVASHPLSNAAQGRSAKLMPRRDGPYVILTQRSPSSYEIASLDYPGEPLGVYHTSALTPCNNDKVYPLFLFVNVAVHQRSHRLLVPRRDAVGTRVTNGRWIGRMGPVNWPVRSSDHSCLDFFLLGHMKSLVYTSPVDSDEALVARIAVIAGDMREIPRVFANVRQSLRQRCEACIFASGCSFAQFL